MSVSSISSTGTNIPLVREAGTRPERPIAADVAPANAPNVLADSQTVQESDRTRNTRPNDQEVEQATRKIQNFVKMANSDLQFSVDKETDRTVVKVIDRSTQEVIRQFPSEEVLQISKSLDKLQGLLFKQQA